MKIAIPTSLRSRERLPFEPTLEELSEHVPFFDDFCVACGADLRVLRVIVDKVPAGAAMLFALARSAELARFLGCTSEQLEMMRFGISQEGRARLTELFCEGLEPDVTYLCGFE